MLVLHLVSFHTFQNHYNDLINLDNFSVKDELCSLTTGYKSFDVENYKYIFIQSIAGNNIVPVSLLKILDGYSFSIIRQINDSIYCVIYLTIYVDKINIHQHVVSGWEQSTITVYGIK